MLQSLKLNDETDKLNRESTEENQREVRIRSLINVMRRWFCRFEIIEADRIEDSEVLKLKDEVAVEDEDGEISLRREGERAFVNFCGVILMNVKNEMISEQWLCSSESFRI
ncbi:unnamed protein product [Vicia faba]|uniref:Uncharacterized protein n=1 Tax=Vicia faba TaxID=3906 RepID=A0AAV0Z6X7_VICFA|nr:unnamed protein product [Vicia faba]